MSIDTSKYSPAQVEYLRDSFASNECGSDEYRECWPGEKGFDYVDAGFSAIHDWEGDDEQRTRDMRHLMKLVVAWGIAFEAQWVKADNDPNEWAAYAGSDEAEVMCQFIFDMMWRVGKSPYAETDAEIIDQLDGFHE